MTKDKLIMEIWENKKINNYCKSISSDWMELRSELIVQLYKMNWEKLLLAYSNGYIEYLSFTICKRIVWGNISGTGVFYKSNKWDELSDDYSLEFEESTYSECIDNIWEMVENKHWYEKTLFKAYYKDGLKLREISVKYGINQKSIHYSIKKLRNEIKKKFSEDIEKS